MADPLWDTAHPINAQFFRLSTVQFFNYTAAAATETPNDIFFGSIALGPPSTGDYFAIGAPYTFSSTDLTISTIFDGVSGFIWQYWNGSAWTALSGVVDGTVGFTVLGLVTVSWDVPSDWVQNTVNGTIAYHVRVLWSPWTSTVTPPRGSLITVFGTVTDPIYGDNPIDPGEQWDTAFRYPLQPDPIYTAIRNVWVGALLEALESQWLTRWRRAVTTAVGAQLDVWGDQLDYIQPAGWTDDRYQAVLTALFPASFARLTPEVVFGLATALLDVGQSFTAVEEWPCAARFTYQETDADDAKAYISALDRARPRGSEYVLVAHPGGGDDPFIVGTSQVAGPDTLAALFEIED